MAPPPLRQGAAFTFNAKSFHSFIQSLRSSPSSPEPIPFPLFSHALKDPSPSPDSILPEDGLMCVASSFLLPDMPLTLTGLLAIPASSKASTSSLTAHLGPKPAPSSTNAFSLQPSRKSVGGGSSLDTSSRGSRRHWRELRTEVRLRLLCLGWSDPSKRPP